jgi:hypothetical protein
VGSSHFFSRYLRYGSVLLTVISGIIWIPLAMAIRDLSDLYSAINAPAPPARTAMECHTSESWWKNVEKPGDYSSFMVILMIISLL